MTRANFETLNLILEANHAKYLPREKQLEKRRDVNLQIYLV
jgi:hypothetical protein